jgi:hypothetical protein
MYTRFVFHKFSPFSFSSAQTQKNKKPKSLIILISTSHSSSILLHIQYPIYLVLYEGSFFAFEDDTIRLQGLYRMPHALRDVHAISAFLIA